MFDYRYGTHLIDWILLGISITYIIFNICWFDKPRKGVK